MRRHLLECLCSVSGRSHKSDPWSLDLASHQPRPEQTSWCILGLCRNVTNIQNVATDSQKILPSRTEHAKLTQVSPVKHVIHTSWCAHHYVRGLCLKLLYFATEIGSTNASMAGCSHIVSKSKNYFLDLIKWKQGPQQKAQQCGRDGTAGHASKITVE